MNTEEDVKHLSAVIKHIANVRENCITLGFRLIKQGEFNLGKELIEHGHIHDHSKFWQDEFEVLRKGNEQEPRFKGVVKLHRLRNKHHPLYWDGGIKAMDDVYLAEFVCDSKARAEEMDSSLKEWIDESATSQFCFTQEDDVYKRIMRFVNLLVEKPF